MSRGMVALLAAAAAAMSALVGLLHGDHVFIAIACDAAVAGVAAYGALPPQKNA
jgi:hypothetical protein